MNQRALRQFNCHDQEQPSWFDRAERAASLIAPLAARTPRRRLSVSDIGCGDMKLRQFLESAGLNCAYQGYDLVPQHPAVAALDIRVQPLPVPTDVAVMLGVVEYLDNLAQVLERLAGEVHWLLLSHVVSDYSVYTPSKLQELGWMNHLARKDFGELLSSSGFAIEAEQLTSNGRTVLWLCRPASSI